MRCRQTATTLALGKNEQVLTNRQNNVLLRAIKRISREGEKATQPTLLIEELVPSDRSKC